MDKYKDLMNLLGCADEEEFEDALEQLYTRVSAENANKSKKKEEKKQALANYKETVAKAINTDKYPTEAVLAMIALATAAAHPSIMVEELQSRSRQQKPIVEVMTADGAAKVKVEPTLTSFIDQAFKDLLNFNKEN